MDSLDAEVRVFFNDRKNAIPMHSSIGEEVKVADNLAVKVVSIGPGPYDYADGTPTVKVVVTMRNLGNETVLVKPSNWNADNTSGKRVNHKIYIEDSEGNRAFRSFGITRVSPHATFEGIVYFDGSALTSVVYEPHWLISSEGQYIYFDMD